MSPGCHPGSDRGHELVGRTDVAREERVEGGGIEVGRGTEPREPAVVDEDVHVTGFLGELGHVVGVGEVGRHEAGVPACLFDGSDRCCTALRVAPVHDHVEAVTRQLQGHRPSDARRCSGDESDPGGCLCLRVHDQTPYVS